MEDLLLGFVADGTGVVEDEAGVGLVRHLGVAFAQQGADDFFGVVGVHLAAESFDVKGLHSVPGYPPPPTFCAKSRADWG
jgi:hypothetical protein